MLIDNYHIIRRKVGAHRPPIQILNDELHDTGVKDWMRLLALNRDTKYRIFVRASGAKEYQLFSMYWLKLHRPLLSLTLAPTNLSAKMAQTFLIKTQDSQISM